MNLQGLFSLSYNEWIIVAVAALLVGLSKSGFSGLTMLVIPILASVFGGKESTGILLPMLAVGDFFAVRYYNRHAEWSSITILLPWTFLGLVIGAVIGKYVNDGQFKMMIGGLVLVCLIMLLYTERKGDSLNVSGSKAMNILSGVAAGFATMIGNAAGPIFSVYLLANGFKKNGFIGTASWFFLIINLTKIPLQILLWKNITLGYVATALVLLPVIGFGVFIGTRIIKRINEKIFRYLVIIMTAIAAVKLFM